MKCEYLYMSVISAYSVCFVWKGVFINFQKWHITNNRPGWNSNEFFYLTNRQFFKHMIQLSINKCYNLLHMEKLNIYFMKLMIVDLHTWIVCKTFRFCFCDKYISCDRKVSTMSFDFHHSEVAVILFSAVKQKHNLSDTCSVSMWLHNNVFFGEGFIVVALKTITFVKYL